jgi:hypothetical protein
VPIRNNNVDGATDRQIRYVTDTDNGSSGPPLLTDDWVVFASAVSRYQRFAPDRIPSWLAQPGCPSHHPRS